MFTLVLSIIFYLIGFYFKTRSGYYASHINTYYLFTFLAAVFLVLWIFNITSSILCRMNFCHKVKKLAKEKGYEYKEVKNPYLSLFTVYGGEDIVLSKRENVIRLKFFQTGISKHFIHITNEKEARFSKRMAYIGFVRAKAPGRPYVGGKEWVKWGEFFALNKKINLEFSKDLSENIVIVSPKCIDLSCVEGNSKKTVGSGQELFGKKIYFQKDFLSYFDRM